MLEKYGSFSTYSALFLLAFCRKWTLSLLQHQGYGNRMSQNLFTGILSTNTQHCLLYQALWYSNSGDRKAPAKILPIIYLLSIKKIWYIDVSDDFVASKYDCVPYFLWNIPPEDDIDVSMNDIFYVSIRFIWITVRNCRIDINALLFFFSCFV